MLSDILHFRNEKLLSVKPTGQEISNHSPKCLLISKPRNLNFILPDIFKTSVFVFASQLQRPIFQ